MIQNNSFLEVLHSTSTVGIFENLLLIIYSTLLKHDSFILTWNFCMQCYTLVYSYYTYIMYQFSYLLSSKHSVVLNKYGIPFAY